MSEYQGSYQRLHRCIDELDRYERGSFGRRTAVSDLARAIDDLVLARVKEILSDKSMDELEQLAQELASPIAAAK